MLRLSSSVWRQSLVSSRLRNRVMLQFRSHVNVLAKHFDPCNRDSTRPQGESSARDNAVCKGLRKKTVVLRQELPAPSPSGRMLALPGSTQVPVSIS